MMLRSEAPVSETLVAEGIVVRFDGLAAIDDVQLSLSPREVLGLIGPNGAGKTTLVNVLTGFQRCERGRVAIGSRDLTTASPERIANAGIARTFQSVRLFREFTVLENLIAASIGAGEGLRESKARAWEILDWLGLSAAGGAMADTLAYGDERKVGIARALAMKPCFLLLDEPAAGLNEAECEVLMNTVRRIPDAFGCGILLIEHNMRVIMNVCDRVHVIDFGKTIAEGTPTAIRAHPEVIRAYLGPQA